MKLIIEACTYREVVRNNIIASFTENTTIGEAEKLIREITWLMLKNKTVEATNILIRKTTFNEQQAQIAIQIISKDFECAE